MRRTDSVGNLSNAIIENLEKWRNKVSTSSEEESALNISDELGLEFCKVIHV